MSMKWKKFFIAALLFLFMTSFTSKSRVFYARSEDTYDIIQLEDKKNNKTLYDINKRKIFEKDINIPKNQVEYEKLKKFLDKQLWTLYQLDTMKKSGLSTSQINAYKKRIVTSKPELGIDQFNSLLEEIKNARQQAKTWDTLYLIFLAIGTIFGFVLFKFYTKKFIYRIENIEEVPKTDENGYADFDITETQVLQLPNLDENLSQTLSVVQHNLYAAEILEEQDETIEDLDNWLFETSEQDNKDKDEQDEIDSSVEEDSLKNNKLNQKSNLVQEKHQDLKTPDFMNHQQLNDNTSLQNSNDLVAKTDDQRAYKDARKRSSAKRKRKKHRNNNQRLGK